MARAVTVVMGLSIFGAACAAGPAAPPPAAPVRGIVTAEVAGLDARCALGEIKACGQLGSRYFRGYGAPRDLNVAEAALVRACDGGDADGCADLGELYLELHRSDAEMARAVALFRASCDRRSARGCARLGRSMIHGIGVPMDRDAGRRLLEASCKRGNADGCLNLGSFYLSPESGRTDYAMAFRHFEEAVMYGGGHGTLALMYWKGYGVAVDMQRARRLLEQGCMRGEASACLNLGIMCQIGEGGGLDHAAAVAHFRRACELGEQRGCGVEPAE